MTLPSAASCNGSGSITVPANTSTSAPVVYTVTLTANGPITTPAANAEITITVPAAAAPAPITTPVATPTPAPSTIVVNLLKVLLKKVHGGVKFTFSATSGATGYQCALVRLPTGKHHHAPKPHYSSCSATKTFKHLKHGKYELFVKAVGPSGLSSALTKTFTVKATTKKHG